MGDTSQRKRKSANLSLCSHNGNRYSLSENTRRGFFSPRKRLLPTLQLYNSHHERLKISVTFIAKDGVDRCRRYYEIAPLSMLEIGALESPWNFESGETAIIHVEGYNKELYVENSGNRYRTWYKYSLEEVLP